MINQWMYMTNRLKLRTESKFLVSFILFSLFFTQQLHADIYRCTDDSGRKIFSDTPCMEGTKSAGTIEEAQTATSNERSIATSEITGTAGTEELLEGVVPVVITGRVAFSNGDPVVGVEVLSWGLKDKSTGFKGMTTGRTDSNGYYKLNIDSRYLWVVYHHGTERREFSRKGPWQGDTTIDFIVPVE